MADRVILDTDAFSFYRQGYGASILTGNRRHFDGLGSVTLIDGS